MSVTTNEERNYTVYMHVNKVNGKTYIGITCNSVNRRWGYKGSYYKTQIFGRAIEKYGWDNFKHIILFTNKTKKEANYLEKLYIKVLISNNPQFGYNVDCGGNGQGRMPESTKLKISKAKIGKKFSEEAKKSMTEKRKKYINPSSKKVICDGRIFGNAKICANHYEVNHSTMVSWLNGTSGMPQYFINLSLKYINDENMRRMNKKNKPVVCDDEIFNSIKECADYYGVEVSTMRTWLNGKNCMPQKFVDINLKYYNEETNIKYEDEVKKKVICGNQIFNSISNASSYCNISKSTMASWLRCERPMPQKYIDLGLRYLGDTVTIYKPPEKGIKKVVCDNKIFNTIKECSKFYKSDYGIMTQYLKGTHKMPQKYIDLGLRYATEEDLNTYEVYNEN